MTPFLIIILCVLLRLIHRYDLKYLSNSGSLGENVYDPKAPGMMGPTRLTLTKPCVAAVEGHAVAGGGRHNVALLFVFRVI